jgi:predicted RNase H-like HicB family nuclease
LTLGEAVKEFVALVYRGTDGGYRVTIPDFPTLTVAGETLERARVRAQYALFFHIHGLVAEGAHIPQPSSLEVIMADWRHQGALETMILAFIEIDGDGDEDEVEDEVYGKNI